MEKGFHDIEQFIAFITPGHTAFHERLSIVVYRRGRAREFSSHKDKPPPARTVSIELLDAEIQETAGFVHWYKAGCFSLLYRKDRLRRSLELKKARTEAGTTSRR